MLFFDTSKNLSRVKKKLSHKGRKSIIPEAITTILFCVFSGHGFSPIDVCDCIRLLTNCLLFFPNRRLLLRVLMATQREEKKGKETESVSGQRGPRPRPQR